jgi:aspartate kinase
MEGILVSGATIQKDLAKISLVGIANNPGNAAMIFAKLGGAKISVNDIIQTEVDEKKANLSFTVAKSDLADAQKTIKALKTQLDCDDIFVREDIAEVSIVGIGMRTHCGVANTMFSALSQAKINIDSITTSEIRISCIIDKEQGDKALELICDAFELDKPAEQRSL